MLVRPHGAHVATVDFQEQDVPIRSCTGGSSTTLGPFSFAAWANAAQAESAPRSGCALFPLFTEKEGRFVRISADTTW